MNEAVAATKQFSTFYVADRMYGIDVTQVQEIARALPITSIHLAPDYVIGLINLRGQIATAIGLRELFNLDRDGKADKMSVVCKCDGTLLSFLVDQIGDVIEVSEADFEEPPQTIEDDMRKFLKGVYKTPEAILSVIEIENVTRFLSK